MTYADPSASDGSSEDVALLEETMNLILGMCFREPVQPFVALEESATLLVGLSYQ